MKQSFEILMCMAHTHARTRVVVSCEPDAFVEELFLLQPNQHTPILCWVSFPTVSDIFLASLLCSKSQQQQQHTAAGFLELCSAFCLLMARDSLFSK